MSPLGKARKLAREAAIISAATEAPVFIPRTPETEHALRWMAYETIPGEDKVSGYKVITKVGIGEVGFL